MSIGEHLLGGDKASQNCPYSNREIGMMMLKLGERVSDIKLYPYQRPLALRIFESLLMSDSETLTALFSRQCLHPDTLIQTPKGLVPIKDIRQGQEIVTLDSSGNFAVDEVIDKWHTQTKLYKITLENGVQIKCGAKHRFKDIDDNWTSVSEGLQKHDLIQIPVAYPTQGSIDNEHTASDNEFAGLLLAQLLLHGIPTSSRLKELRNHDILTCYIQNEKYAKRVAKALKSTVEHSNRGFKLKCHLNFDDINLYEVNLHRHDTLKHMFKTAEITTYMGNRFRKYRIILRPTSQAHFRDELLSFFYLLGLKPIYNEKQDWIEFTDYQSFFILEPFIRWHPLHSRILEYLNTKRNQFGFHYSNKQYKQITRTYRGFLSQYTRQQHYHYNNARISHTSFVKHATTAGFARPHLFVSLSNHAYMRVTDIEELDTQLAYDIETKVHNTYIANSILNHNSGKTETVAVTVTSCMIWLPQFAHEFPNDERFQKFKRGFWAGIFAPVLDQADTMFSRIKQRLTSPVGTEILAEFDLTALPKGKTINLSNNSFAFCKPAGENVNIESKTLHLAICDESQDVSSHKIRKSIVPMCAATGGTKLFIGTSNTKKSYYHEAIQYNISKELKQGIRNHFQADWEVAAKYNPYYKNFVTEEMDRMGYDSDEFKMSFRNIFIFQRGMMVDPILLERYHPETNPKGLLHDYEVSFDYNGRSVICVGLDLGKTTDSTVLTAVEIDLSSPIESRSYIAYKKKIIAWKDMIGDDFEIQFAHIYEFVMRYRANMLVVDATGKGEPIFDRLYVSLPYVEVIPFVFSQKSKDLLFKSFIADLNGSRIMIPDGPATRQTKEYRKFLTEMGNMEKEYSSNGYLNCHAPNIKGAHDDYPVSLALACWGAREERIATPEVVDNPFL